MYCGRSANADQRLGKGIPRCGRVCVYIQKKKIQTRPKTHGMCDYRQYDSRKYTPLKEYNEVVFVRNIRPASACCTTKTFSSMDDG